MASTMPAHQRPDDGESWSFLGSKAVVRASAATTGGALSVLEFTNPPGFAPPWHTHLDEVEAFYVLDGAAVFLCGTERFEASRGDFVLLPAGLPHAFLVADDAPLRALQITAPGGFERFVAEVGRPYAEAAVAHEDADPAVLVAAAARHRIEIVGPPPS